MVHGKRPVGRKRIRWLDFIENMVWKRLGLHPIEMIKKCGGLTRTCCPFNSQEKAGEKKEINIHFDACQNAYLVNKKTFLSKILFHLNMQKFRLRNLHI